MTTPILAGLSSRQLLISAPPPDAVPSVAPDPPAARQSASTSVLPRRDRLVGWWASLSGAPKRAAVGDV